MDLSLNMLSWVLKNLKQHEFLFSAAIWWIWRARNNDVFNSDSHWNLEKSLRQTRKAAFEFKKVSSTSFLSLTPPPITYAWIPPPSSIFKCGCKDVICKTDCIDAYLLVNKTHSSMDTTINDLLVKIHDAIHWDWSVSILPIQRTTNRVADLLARRTTSLRLRYTE
ncbi:hypothetical protein PIB30_097660 [Stylosanthes scabra]|uniref:RNase H type-1 domain-containing protein n=1 Tax=Stylosanthes scabra TaxID=79078 RepID=A0ABU6QXE6_9FABA|nr:hypothetical protein [Stylosanthes scabra]